MNSLKKVFIFGGTHGNEWTGIYAIKKFSEALSKEFSELDIQFIHANPEAYKQNRRFVHEDLNRAFQFLHENRSESYEHARAKELKKIILEEPCFVLDLHTTTSNMGNTVIISHDHPMNFYVASQLTSKLQDTRVILSPDPNLKFLASQSKFGMMVEVGPVANGMINPIALEGTLQIIKEVLRAISTPMNLTGGAVEIYEEIEDIYYLQNESGELISYIHPGFQGKDFAAIEGEYLPFKKFSGEEVMMETKEEMFPIFINEAAYYPSKLAFTLCRKRKVSF